MILRQFKAPTLLLVHNNDTISINNELYVINHIDYDDYGLMTGLWLTMVTKPAYELAWMIKEEQ